ncbi:hypothetical protein [Limnohabitans sp. T6-20]|uniref:hypothetical protein n=1 Tax=Limnohabitans sp. T6-20 TaxID=1100725 RepID=UPI0011B1D3BC|nr:hypothetical protein [Limnohabitans sp. T6-20]
MASPTASLTQFLRLLFVAAPAHFSSQASAEQLVFCASAAEHNKAKVKIANSLGMMTLMSNSSKSYPLFVLANVV